MVLEVKPADDFALLCAPDEVKADLTLVDVTPVLLNAPLLIVPVGDAMLVS